MAVSGLKRLFVTPARALGRKCHSGPGRTLECPGGSAQGPAPSPPDPPPVCPQPCRPSRFLRSLGLLVAS